MEFQTMARATTRRTQADRRAATREALLEATARGLSTYGYGNLVLDQVANDAGYTRGALYHLFANKGELTLAVVAWVRDTWDAEVRCPALLHTDPLASLMAIARGHALYCRGNERASIMLTLRIEFTGQDHAVGRALKETYDELETFCAGLIADGRRNHSIPPGPPARLTAAAFLAVLESVAIEVAGNSRYDVALIRRAVRGVLGVAPLEPTDRSL